MDAQWIHGHSLEVEHPDRLVSMERFGYFTRLLARPGGQQTWVHFAVPTPVIRDDRRLVADSVLVRFRTTPTDAWVHAVHVYDGENRIGVRDGLDERPAEWSMLRMPVESRPLRWGIGISVGVQFHLDPGGDPPLRIDFASAGCDFV